MKYKMLALDIDGTLVGKSSTVSEENNKALHEAIDCGITVTLCTGRAPRGAQNVLTQLGLDGYHTFFDGALVINPETAKVIYSQELEPRVLLRAISWSRANEMDIDLYSETKYFAARENWSTQVHRDFFNFAPVITEFDTLVGKEKIIKIGTTVRNQNEADKLNAFRQYFKGKLNFTSVRSPSYPEVDFINVVSPLVSKGNAILKLCEFMNFDCNQVMAIGDGLNDISLLSVAGLAIAMPHAPNEVKTVADYVTVDVEKSGVAEAIKRFLLF
jgi:5-amino-6-(5-phospho-D-ribitylamino)uracil phosphatase